MPKLMCFDTESRDFIVSEPKLGEQMPFIEYLPMTMEDFLYPHEEEICWTEKRALLALDRLAQRARLPFTVDGGFRRGGFGGCASLARRAGLSVDTARTLSQGERRALGEAAITEGGFAAVTAPFFAGRSLGLFFELRMPVLEEGDKGVYVLAFQDALRQGGFDSLPLSGALDAGTRLAMEALKEQAGLPQAKIVDGRMWHAALALTNPLNGGKIGAK